MYDILWQLLLQVLLIGLNAVFACAEIAVLSVNETKLERMAADGAAGPVFGDDPGCHYVVRFFGQRLCRR